MEGLLSLLLFAAFFYFMMRWGCGAHMAHGHGGHGGHGGSAGGHQGHHGPEQTASNTSATDPVCGMTVDPGEGYARMYEGQEYRFCSRKCLDRFDADPARHARVAGGAA